MPLLGQRWPTGQNDVGPPVAANGGPTAGPPVAQRWATGVVLSGGHRHQLATISEKPALLAFWIFAFTVLLALPTEVRVMPKCTSELLTAIGLSTRFLMEEDSDHALFGQFITITFVFVRLNV